MPPLQVLIVLGLLLYNHTAKVVDFHIYAANRRASTSPEERKQATVGIDEPEDWGWFIHLA
ncbi:hypothetical protein BH10CYA1_BH10CYA1_03950 [soil metagenome]